MPHKWGRVRCRQTWRLEASNTGLRPGRLIPKRKSQDIKRGEGRSGEGWISIMLTYQIDRSKSNQCTCSLLVEETISLSPMQTPCLSSLLSLSRPRSSIGIISGKTLSPSLRTRSPRVRAATWKNANKVRELISIASIVVSNYKGKRWVGNCCKLNSYVGLSQRRNTRLGAK